MVAQGKVERIVFEESHTLAWKRGGARVLVIARAKYQTVDGQGESAVEKAPLPAEVFPRLTAAPSMLAHILCEKSLTACRCIASRSASSVTVCRSTEARCVDGRRM
jgi:hypothetical protein